RWAGSSSRRSRHRLMSPRCAHAWTRCAPNARCTRLSAGTRATWRELAHVPGAALASRSIIRRPEDSTSLYGLGPPDLGAWRQRRQPFAEPGSAGRERKAAGDVSSAVDTRLTVVTHPLVQHKLSYLRDRATPTVHC